MGVLTNNIPRVVSEVLAGINSGVQDVGSIVSNVTANPPEKVVFQMDAIDTLNFFERQKIVVVPEKKQVTQVEEVTARDEFYLNGVLAEIKDYVDSSAYTVERTFAPEGYTQRTYEDSAVGVTLEIEGPKSS
jgi:hypothetical protein